MPSLFDNLLQGSFYNDPDTARLLNRYDNMFGKGAGPSVGGGSPSSPTTQGGGGLPGGLPSAFGYDPGPSYVRPPVVPPMPPSFAPEQPNTDQMNGAFDFQTALNRIANIGKKDKKTSTTTPEKSFSEKMIDLLLRRQPSTADDLTGEGQQGTFALPTVTGDAKAKVPRPRVLTPLEGPDTGEVAPDMQGVPAGYFSKVSGPESSGRLNAINPISKAVGLYQFLPTTLRDLKAENPDLVMNTNWWKDKDQQDAWMRAYTQRSVNALKPIIGDRMPTMGELYMMHFFGQKGGEQLLRNKDKTLGSLLPDIVFKWNPGLKKNQTAGDFVDTIDKTWGAP